MKHFVLDSSVYISYLNPKDVLHIETEKFINKVTSPGINFVVPIIVFLEVGNVLQKSLPKFRNENLIRFFEDHNIVNLDIELAKELLMISKNFSLKTSDAIILGIAILNNATLITWDDQFKKNAEKFIEVQNPRQFLDGLDITIK